MHDHDPVLDLGEVAREVGEAALDLLLDRRVLHPAGLPDEDFAVEGLGEEPGPDQVDLGADALRLLERGLGPPCAS